MCVCVCVCVVCVCVCVCLFVRVYVGVLGFVKHKQVKLLDFLVEISTNPINKLYSLATATVSDNPIFIRHDSEQVKLDLVIETNDFHSKVTDLGM